MKFLRLFIIIAMALIGLAWYSQRETGKKTNARHDQVTRTSRLLPDKKWETLRQKAAAARLFTQRKGFNEKTCFLIDMSLPSGQERFFIYDLSKDSVLASGLVAHGNCFEYWLEGRRYSNVVGSGCTSLGKYKIGNPYTGKFGYSYKLFGLDTSNNNAYERTVVLHSHSCVPETAVADEICQSNGCPTVSPNLLGRLKNIINNSGKPLLLWIYN